MQRLFLVAAVNGLNTLSGSIQLVLKINANKNQGNDHLQASIQIGDLSPESLIPGAERVTAFSVPVVVISFRPTMGITLTNSSHPVPLPSLPYEFWSQMASVHHCFIRLPERQRLPRCYKPHRLGGACNRWGKSRMERLFGRLRRRGYTAGRFSIGWDLGYSCWVPTTSFSSQLLATRTIHEAPLPREREACGYNLRTRSHNFALPVKDYNNFVSRSLYAELKS